MPGDKNVPKMYFYAFYAGLRVRQIQHYLREPQQTLVCRFRVLVVCTLCGEQAPNGPCNDALCNLSNELLTQSIIKQAGYLDFTEIYVAVIKVQSHIITCKKLFNTRLYRIVLNRQRGIPRLFISTPTVDKYIYTNNQSIIYAK